jgi:hypothetical protein
LFPLWGLGTFGYGRGKKIKRGLVGRGGIIARPAAFG